MMLSRWYCGGERERVDRWRLQIHPLTLAATVRS